MRAFEDEKYRIERKEIQDEIDLENAVSTESGSVEDVKKLQRLKTLNEDIERLGIQHNAKMADFDRQSANDFQKMIDQQIQSIKRLSDTWAQDWVKITNAVITHKQSIGTAVTQMMGQIELEMIDKGIKKIVTMFTQQMLSMVLATKFTVCANGCDCDWQ